MENEEKAWDIFSLLFYATIVGLLMLVIVNAAFHLQACREEEANECLKKGYAVEHCEAYALGSCL